MTTRDEWIRKLGNINSIERVSFAIGLLIDLDERAEKAEAELARQNAANDMLGKLLDAYWEALDGTRAERDEARGYAALLATGYLGGIFTNNEDEWLVGLRYSSSEQAEQVFDALTDVIDAALAGKSER